MQRLCHRPTATTTAMLHKHLSRGRDNGQLPSARKGSARRMPLHEVRAASGGGQIAGIECRAVKKAVSLHVRAGNVGNETVQGGPIQIGAVRGASRREVLR